MSGMFKKDINLETWLDYVPIRSEGNREQSFNQQFWCHDEHFLATRYNISIHQYDSRFNFLFENAYLIESTVDQGRPIAINALEHCRVCVGYNDQHLLFADSWSTDYMESNASGSDCNIAGFSIVDKWLVYSWMRDVVSIKKEKTKIKTTEMKETKEMTDEGRYEKKRRTQSELDTVDLTGATVAATTTAAAAAITTSSWSSSSSHGGGGTCTISLLSSEEEGEEEEDDDCFVCPPPLSSRIPGITTSGLHEPSTKSRRESDGE